MGWRHVKQLASVASLCAVLALSLTAVFALQQGTKFLSIQSGSMVPTFHKGDLVIVNRAPDGNYRVGDIITFINPRNDKQTITHRVHQLLPSDGMQGKRVVTKGDANAAADIPIYTNKIVGKVAFSIPYFGFGFDFVRQPIGLLIAIYIPALTIMASEVRRLARYYKDQEPYVANGFDPRQPKPSQTKRMAKAGSIATIAVVAAVVPSVQAALMSTATLTGNTISSVQPQTLNHPVISKVAFGSASNGSNTNINVVNNNPQTATSGNASSSNNGSGGGATSGNASNSSNTSFNFNVSGSSGGSVPPTVTIYNPTNSPVNVSGWTLTDNNSTRSLPTGTVIAAKASYSFNWPQIGGLDKLGDRLVLRSNPSTNVDGLSWGTDTSQLNPAIVINPGTTSISRNNPNLDSNSSADWSAN